MHEPRFGVLRVVQPAADAAAARRANDNRNRRAPAVPKPQRRRLIDDLVEGAGDEIGKLHLGNGPVAAHRRADADADDGRLGNRRVDDARLAELLEQPLGHAEGAAVRADVLAEHEHLRVAPHFLGERFADGFQIRQLFAHGTTVSRIRHRTGHRARDTDRAQPDAPRSSAALRPTLSLVARSALRIQIRHGVLGSGSGAFIANSTASSIVVCARAPRSPSSSRRSARDGPAGRS